LGGGGFGARFFEEEKRLQFGIAERRDARVVTQKTAERG
jgi:hypothetical protein